MAAEIVRSRDAAAALLHPERHRILELLRTPDSASGLGRKLGLARQRLNYHLKELESAGLVELVEERRRGNCTERLLRTTATTYLLSPEVLGTLGETVGAAQEAFSSAYLVQAAGKTIHDLGILREKAKKAGKSLATLTIESEVRFASPADRHAFATELANAVAALVARYHQPDHPQGRDFRLLVGVHPALPKPKEAVNG